MELRLLRYFPEAAREGLGAVLSFGRLISTGPGTGLCSRSPDPPLRFRLYPVRKSTSSPPFRPAPAGQIKAGT